MDNVNIEIIRIRTPTDTILIFLNGINTDSGNSVGLVVTGNNFYLNFGGVFNSPGHDVPYQNNHLFPL